MSLKIRPVWFLLSIVILIELGYTRLIPILRCRVHGYHINIFLSCVLQSSYIH